MRGGPGRAKKLRMASEEGMQGKRQQLDESDLQEIDEYSSTQRSGSFLGGLDHVVVEENNTLRKTQVRLI